MPDPRGGAELEFMTFLLRFCDANVPHDKLGDIGDALETDPEIDAAEFRAWFEERITNPDHRNYLSPEGWTRKTGELYDAGDYEGLARERLRPVWHSIWKRVPDVDKREFPAYGPIDTPPPAPRSLSDRFPRQTRREDPPDPGPTGTPGPPPNPRPGGSFPGQRAPRGDLPGAPGAVAPKASPRRTVPAQRRSGPPRRNG